MRKLRIGASLALALGVAIEVGSASDVSVLHAVARTRLEALVPSSTASQPAVSDAAQPGGGGGGGGGSSTFGGTTYVAGPTTTPTTTLPEAEEHVAVAPTNASALVAAISDFSLRGGSNTTKYAWSLDAGSTWHESYVPLVAGAPATADGMVWPYNSDPVVAIDRPASGAPNVYIANLYFHSETNDNRNGLYVSVAPLGSTGVAFLQSTTRAVSVQLDPATSVSEDKDWIAVDTTSGATAGYVYVSWTRFVGNRDMIVVSRSTDRGQTWSAPVQVSDPSHDGGVQGSQVAVGPNGEVFVVYEVSYVGGVGRQFLAKSAAGGQGFSKVVAITPTYNQLSFRSTYRKNDFASLAVGQDDANQVRVHVVYADQPSKASAIEYVRSLDGGATFSAPVRMNDASSAQRLMPAVATDETGAVHVSWFDTRNASRSTASYDIYATRSRSHGDPGTFGPNARVTSQLVNAGSASFIGDYAGIAAGGGFAHPVWTSGGFNSGLLQSAALH